MRRESEMRTIVLVVLLSVMLAGCGPSPPPFKPVLTVDEIMHGIVDPAADVLWASVGTIITVEGREEIYPRSEEEWTVVTNATMMLMEAGNLLMIGDRAIDDEEWMRMAGDFVDVGKLAMEATASHDPQRVFDIGGEVYAACTACHERYWVEDASSGNAE